VEQLVASLRVISLLRQHRGHAGSERLKRKMAQAVSNSPK